MLKVTSKHDFFYFLDLYRVASEASLENQASLYPTHVININITDNHEDAIVGAYCIEELASGLSKCKDIDNEIEAILDTFQKKYEKRVVFHSMFFI